MDQRRQKKGEHRATESVATESVGAKRAETFSAGRGWEGSGRNDVAVIYNKYVRRGVRRLVREDHTPGVKSSKEEVAVMMLRKQADTPHAQRDNEVVDRANAQI